MNGSLLAYDCYKEFKQNNCGSVITSLDERTFVVDRLARRIDWS